jgi:alkylation response protein AidB-like acyl-CoA dehydrogenase
VNFDLDEAQLLLEQTVDDYARSQCPPSRVREIFDGPTGFDERIWKGLAELGLLGLNLPEEYGGGGADLLEVAVAAEVIGRRAIPGPFFEHVLAGIAVNLAGSEEQRAQWLPKLAAGEVRASLALCETSRGQGTWSASSWTLQGETLDGVKYFVPHADGAELLVVGTAGGGLALVQPDDTVSVEAVEGLDRTRRVGHVRFAGTPATLLPGGAAVSQRIVDAGLVLLAADAYGAATACVTAAVEYAKVREQYGAPIGSFQALQHQLADMALQIYPARGLIWLAAHAWDQLPGEAETAAATAKAHLCERFSDVARRTVEAHGGIGYTWECDVQIWLKRSLFDWAMLGEPRQHRRRCADLLGW